VDVHLQDLRRRAGASGNVQDQAALLRARVRAGELAQELLELAAFCGSEAARLVVDPSHQVGTATGCASTSSSRTCLAGPMCPAGCLSALPSWRRGWRCARSSTAPCASEARPRYMTAELRRAAAALTAAEAWLACPCEEHEEAWIVASRERRQTGSSRPSARARRAASPGRSACRCPGGAGEAPVRTAIRDALVAFALGAPGA
jgi:hypothetical protein